MHKLFFALLLACFALPARAGLCPTCEPEPEGGGGGGGSPPPGGAPAVGNVYANDPVNGQLETVLKKSGTGTISFVVDKATDRLYMNNGFVMVDAPLTTIAADAFPGNAGAQQNFLNRVRGGLTNLLELSQGSVTASGPANLMQDGSGMPTKPCYFYGSACYFVVDTWHTSGVQHPGFDGGGYSGSYIQTDKQLWQYDKNKACQDKPALKATYGTSIVATFAACMAVKSGASWTKTACGAGIAAMLITRDQLVDANRTCSMTTYPGPGRW